MKALKLIKIAAPWILQLAVGSRRKSQSESITPLMRSILDKNKTSFHEFLEKETLNEVDMSKNSALHYAADSGDEEMCDALLERKANVYAQDFCGRTPLIKSILSDNQNCFYPILQADDSQVNLSTNENETALHYAAEHGDYAMCDALLNNGADVDARSKTNTTPLMLSVMNNNEKCFDRILETGANIMASDVFGNTALHFAEKYGYMYNSLLKEYAKKYDYKSTLFRKEYAKQ